MPKRKDLEVDSDEGSSSDTSVEAEEKPKAKKSKATGQKSKDSGATSKKEKQENEDIKFELGKKKFITVRSFKGTRYVDIREWYEDRQTEELKPGKKGISLDLSQWQKLKSLVDEIDAAA